MNEPYILVCSPATEPPAPVALCRHCHQCGTEVWVSAAVRPRVDAGEMKPTCLDCARPLMAESSQQAMIHPDQVQELRDLGIFGFAKDLVDLFNQRGRRER